MNNEVVRQLLDQEAIDKMKESYKIDLVAHAIKSIKESPDLSSKNVDLVIIDKEGNEEIFWKQRFYDTDTIDGE